MKTFHFCAMYQRDTGSLSYFDGTLTSKGITSDNYPEVKEKIAASRVPPIDREKLIVLSLTRLD